MADGFRNQAIRQTLLRLHGADVLSDAALLERFASLRDENAFGAIVRRHGPMVLGVCRRVLDDDHLAEDAFQAAFVVVARKAAMLAQPHFADGSIAGWLHKVALQIAGRARRGSLRRSTHERPLGERAAVSVSAHEDEVVMRDLRPVLDEELARLPEKYRMPLLLCYLEGKTHEEAARQLQWPVGTVKGQLARGRDALRRRLTRRGLALSASGLALTGLLESAAAAVPGALQASTVKGAVLMAAGQAAPDVLSVNAAALAEATLQGMHAAWRRAVLGLLLGGLLLGGGVFLFAALRAHPTPAPEFDQPFATLGRHQGLSLLRFADDGRTLLSLSPRDPAKKDLVQDVVIWDVAGRRELARFSFDGHLLAASPDTTLLAVTRGDRSGIRLIDGRTGRQKAVLAGVFQQGSGEPYNLACAAISPDGRFIAVGERPMGGAWGVWETGTGRQRLRRDSQPRSGFQNLAWSPDGKTLAAVRWPHPADEGAPGKASRRPQRFQGVLLDPATGDERATFERPHGICAVHRLDFSPDSRWVAAQAAADDSQLTGPLCFFDAKTGRERASAAACLDSSTCYRLSPDGKSLSYVNRGEDGAASTSTPAGEFRRSVQNLILHEIDTGKERLALRLPVWDRRLPNSGGLASFIAIGPDGTSVAIGQPPDGEIQLWQALDQR